MAIRLKKSSKTIGQNLWLLRRRSKRSLREVASDLNIDITDLKTIERGRDYSLLAVSIFKFASHYGVGPKTLFMRSYFGTSQGKRLQELKPNVVEA